MSPKSWWLSKGPGLWGDSLSSTCRVLLNLLIFSPGHAASVEELRSFEVLKAKNDGLVIKGLGSRER